MSEFVKHESCPKCGSKDNVAVYSDGFKECMSMGCDYIVKSNGDYSSKKTDTEFVRVSVPQGVPMPSKAFNPDVVNNYNVTLHKDDYNREWVIFPTYVGNIPVGFKKRLLRDDKGKVVWATKQIYWGKDGTKPGLFGMQACKGRDGLIITEGEFDAMAASEMYGLKYDVVSITKGANAAAKSIKQHLDFIRNYREIIVCFDSDEPGQMAADEVIKVLPRGRAKLANLPVKDAFDMLKDKRDKEFRVCMQKAKAFIPETLVTGSALAQAAKTRTRDSAKKGIDTGYPALNLLSGGLKPGEVITVVAGTGVGKTTFTINLSYNIMMGGNPTLFIPLEMSLDNIVNRYYEIHTGRKIYTPEGVMIPNDYDEVIDEISENLVIFDHIGSIEMEKLLDDINFAASAYNVNCVVLDHKDAAMACLGEGTSDYRAIDSLMGQLKKLAIDCGVAIILVSHQSRSSEDKEDNKASLSRVRGSQGVAQNSDMVLGLERQRDSHVTKVKTLKAHRLIGQYGDFDLIYDAETKRMKQVDLEEEHDEIQPTSSQVQQPNVQVKTGGGSSQEQSTIDVRSGTTSEVLQDLPARLPPSKSVREENSHRSEGLHDGTGQSQDVGSEETESRNGHTVHVPSTSQEDSEEQETNVRDMGRETQIPMVSESNSTQDLGTGVKPLIALDLETAGFINKGQYPSIVCYSYSNGEVSNVVEGTDGLQDILNTYTPIFHNASFDVAVLRGLGYEVPSFHDSMILANTLNSNREVGLDSLCKQYEIKNAKIKFDMKQWAKDDFPCTEELMTYCQRDTEATWELWEALTNEADEKQYNLYEQNELAYCEIVMQMEKTGFKLDVDGAIDFAFELSTKMKEISNKITTMFPTYPDVKVYKTEKEGRELVETRPRTDGKEGLEYVYREYVPFNPGSNVHKAWALMEQGWKPQVMTKSGQPKLDDSIISSIANKYPLASLYSEYAKYKKLHSSFAKPFIDKSDSEGVLRGSFNQCGTVTGRLSSSNPNLQNVPASGEGGKIRGLLGVQEGHKIVGGDLSNIEARILAHYLEVAYKDSTMANAFRNGLDLHWENAKAWGIAEDPTLEDGKKDPGRRIAKTMLYLIMYGGSHAKLADSLGISEKEAKKHFATFEKNCPSLGLLKNMVWGTLKKRGHIKTLLGRRLSYSDINSKKFGLKARAERQSFNALIQGSAADIFKDLSVKTMDVCKKYNASFIASIHDETLFSVPEDNADEFAKEVTEIWSNQKYLCIPVTAEFSKGDNWNDVK